MEELKFVPGSRIVCLDFILCLLKDVVVEVLKVSLYIHFGRIGAGTTSLMEFVTFQLLSLI